MVALLLYFLPVSLLLSPLKTNTNKACSHKVIRMLFYKDCEDEKELSLDFVS